MSETQYEEFIPFNDRPEWSDVTPVEQDEGPNPIVPIAYSHEYKNTMDYFRAVVQKNEQSERALKLTEEVILLNPAHYTVWLYRQKLITNLKIDLYEELKFLNNLVEENPKCYQLWQHRQFIIGNLKESKFEREFLRNVLEEDSKNFHAWSYSQWVVRTFNTWDDELKFVDEMIESDIRNNSAWNQRYYILTQRPQQLTDSIIEDEIKYTISKIQMAPHNECSWSYLPSIIKHYFKENSLSKLFEAVNSIKQQSPPISSKFFADFEFETNLESYKLTKNQEHGQLALQLVDQLIKRDIVRAKYWNYRKESLTKLINELSTPLDNLNINKD